MAVAGYVWFDAEFSSLELDNAVLLQVAAMVTDSHLELLSNHTTSIEIAIKLDEKIIPSKWVSEHLNSLVDRCRGIDAVHIDDADEKLYSWLQLHFPSDIKQMNERPILAGNSIHNDWFMVRKFLPNFNSKLNYRLLDVSSFKTGWEGLGKYESFDKSKLDLLNMYYPGPKIDKLEPHDALFDIKASIAEMAYYYEKLGFNSI